jgi:hypothetical protein
MKINSLQIEIDDLASLSSAKASGEIKRSKPSGLEVYKL